MVELASYPRYMQATQPKVVIHLKRINNGYKLHTPHTTIVLNKKLIYGKFHFIQGEKN